MIVPQATTQIILTDTSVSTNARVVYTQLVWCHSEKKGCFPKIQTLAKSLGLSERTVIRAIHELEAADWIVTNCRKGGLVNQYRLRKHVQLTVKMSVSEQVANCQNVTQLTDKLSVTSSVNNEPITSITNVIDDDSERIAALNPENELAIQQQLIPVPGKPKRKTANDDQADQQFVAAWSSFIGHRPSNWADARNQAKDLIAAGCTVEDIPALYEWCKSLDWVKGGVDLRLMRRQYDEFVDAKKPKKVREGQRRMMPKNFQ